MQKQIPLQKSLQSRMHSTSVVPTDGFYEWKKIGPDKQSYRILVKDQIICSMATYGSPGHQPEGEEIKSCTIITTDPNSLMVEIHD